MPLTVENILHDYYFQLYKITIYIDHPDPQENVKSIIFSDENNIIEMFTKTNSSIGTFLLLPHHLLLPAIFNIFLLVSSLFYPGAERGILG